MYPTHVTIEFTPFSLDFNVITAEYARPRGGGGGGGGARSIHDGGSDGASYCKPK